MYCEWHRKKCNYDIHFSIKTSRSGRINHYNGELNNCNVSRYKTERNPSSLNSHFHCTSNTALTRPNTCDIGCRRWRRRRLRHARSKSAVTDAFRIIRDARKWPFP
jgi:hypothetical protein